MILYSGRQPERLSARIYFIIYTCIISIPYLILILFIFPYFSFFKGANFLVRESLSALLVLPFIVKMPVFGLHFWLPKAHVEARTRGSIILAGLLLKLGRYGILRMYFIFEKKTLMFLSIWVLSATLSGIITLIQSDVKKLIAYRRVTHMTFIIIGLISGRKVIFIRVILLSLAHG